MYSLKKLLFPRKYEVKKSLKDKIIEIYRPIFENRIKINQYDFHKEETGVYFRAATELVGNKFLLRFQIRKRDYNLLQYDVEKDECIICFEPTRNYLKCCRKSLCYGCLKKIRNENCPHCRTFFTYSIETFEYDGVRLYQLGISI